MSRKPADPQVGERIREVVKWLEANRGLKKKDIATALDVSSSALGHSFRTGAMSPITLYKLAKLSGRSLAFFLTGDMEEVIVPVGLRRQIAQLIDLYQTQRVSPAMIDRAIDQFMNGGPSSTLGIEPELLPLIEHLQQMALRRTLPSGAAAALMHFLQSLTPQQPSPKEIAERVKLANAALDAVRHLPLPADISFTGRKKQPR